MDKWKEKWNLEENKKNMENTANKMMEIEEERMESKKKRMKHWKWSRRNRIGICWLCSDRNDWIQKISDSLHLEIGESVPSDGDGNNQIEKTCNLVQLEVRLIVLFKLLWSQLVKTLELCRFLDESIAEIKENGNPNLLQFLRVYGTLMSGTFC